MSNNLERPDSATPVRGAEALSFCHSRREFDAQGGIFFCAHPKVHATGNLVDIAVCRGCNRWQEPPPERFRTHVTLFEKERSGPCLYLGNQTGLRECATCKGKVQLKVFECRHPEHNEITLPDCNTCLDYTPALVQGKIREWAIGVTTAPRKEPTLLRSVESLLNAGFSGARLFVEPGTAIPQELAQLPQTHRGETLGAWPNWYLALAELYMRQPYADAFFIAQDDVLFCHDLRAFLEAVLWPTSPLGGVSLYQPTSQATTGFRSYSSAQGIPGALALVFPNAAVRSLLSFPEALLHRRRGPAAGLLAIDHIVGVWAHRRKLPIFFHSPSLTQHIGDTTTLWDPAQDHHLRRATSFVGEEFSALSLLPELQGGH